jgi:hypothetical protein
MTLLPSSLRVGVTLISNVAIFSGAAQVGLEPIKTASKRALGATVSHHTLAKTIGPKGNARSFSSRRGNTSALKKRIVIS